MTPEAMLIELLGRVGDRQDAPLLISDDELNQWPTEAVAAMKTQGLIKKARPASSAACPGCERDCVMPVHTLPGTHGGTEPFIVCDKRSDINRVPVSPARLIQWQCNADAVCRFIAASLGIRQSSKGMFNANLWEIGIATGDKRSQMLCLQTDRELTLAAGHLSLPLTEFTRYDGGEYSIDKAMIRQLVDTATTADHRYTPTTHRREVRKRETQAMYESWRKAYRKLTREHPGKSASWCAQRIAKMEIARGKSPETIRKRMKG